MIILFTYPRKQVKADTTLLQKVAKQSKLTQEKKNQGLQSYTLNMLQRIHSQLNKTLKTSISIVMTRYYITHNKSTNSLMIVIQTASQFY